MISGGMLGRYRLLQRLGAGGMGEVYLALALGAAGFEKPVAVKLLRPQLSDDPARIRELLREALIGVELRHPHVVEVLDLGCEGGRHFIAMEYVRGFDLARVLEYTRQVGRPMPVAAAVHMAWAVADALGYLHDAVGPDGESLGLIHGDVSAGNVLVGIDGLIKLSDFGVATFVEAASHSDRIAGKFSYLPPEAFAGSKRVQHWDLYSLGVMLYACVANRLPYEGDTMAEVMRSLDAEPPSPRRIRSSCPRSLSDMIMQAIHRSPDERFHTSADFRAALDAAHPRLVEDADRHRAFLQQVYSSDEWVDRHGELPTTGRLPATETFDGYLEVEQDETADLRAPKSLRIGLSPAHGAKAARAHGQVLSSILERRLGRRVQTTAFADYSELIEAISTGQVDLAWMPPVTFVEAAERGAEVMVVAKRRGVTSYRSVVFVRQSSPIRTLDQLRGTTIAWVDPESSSGYLASAVMIEQALGPLDEVFAEQHFHGSHRAVCDAVLNGWAAAGATYANVDPDGNYTSSGWSDFLGDRVAEIRTIAASAPIPGDNIAHRAGLPGALVAEITRVLINLGRDSEGSSLLADVFNAEEFVRAQRVEYAGVRPLLALRRARVEHG